MTEYTNLRLRIAVAASLTAALCTTCGVSSEPEIENCGSYCLVRQKEGPTLGYSNESGLRLIRADGFVFKDLNRNGQIDPYEDWRNTPRMRAETLAADLSPEEIAGLMLYSPHQAVPTDSVGFWSSTYDGTSLRESGLLHSAVSDKQKRFLREDNLRAVLVVRVESPRIAAEWNNNLQAFVEGLKHGIPVNISSDPRNETRARAEYNAGAGGKISLWPSQLGLAATFDPELVERFGRIASAEYRALGIATALSPQIDLATEPRWVRFSGTFGEDPDLATDLARAYVDGFQTSDGETEIADGWGYESVNAMVKHWPGGGPEEGGRDAHYSFGKYAVYPGGNFEEHLRPFIKGAFRLRGRTGKAAAVMPYYTISWGVNPSGENIGNGFSRTSSQTCCVRNTDTTASYAPTGASHTTTPASKSPTANAGERKTSVSPSGIIWPSGPVSTSSAATTTCVRSWQPGTCGPRSSAKTPPANGSNSRPSGYCSTCSGPDCSRIHTSIPAGRKRLSEIRTS